MHNVGAIGAEDRVDTGKLPVLPAHIQNPGGAQVVQFRLINPGLDSGMIDFKITGLPFQVRQAGGKMHRVLTGPAGDFEYVRIAA